MVDLELFNLASRVLVDCPKFWFSGVLRKKPKEFAEEWNEHIILKNSNDGPFGHFNLFLASYLWLSRLLRPLEDGYIDELLPAVEEIPPNYSLEFGESAEIIMAKEGIKMSVDVKSCLDLYLLLLEEIEEFS